MKDSVVRPALSSSRDKRIVVVVWLRQLGGEMKIELTRTSADIGRIGLSAGRGFKLALITYAWSSYPIRDHVQTYLVGMNVVNQIADEICKDP